MGRPPEELATRRVANGIKEVCISLNEVHDEMRDVWNRITQGDRRITGLAGNGDVLMWLVQLNGLRLQVLFWLRDGHATVGYPNEAEVVHQTERLSADNAWLQEWLNEV